MNKTSQLNVHNIKHMRAQAPEKFDALRVDSNNDCNVQCVYCHNHRSKDTIGTDDLRAFFDENIVSVDNFQIGCIMEPTLDPRMCDLMLMAAGSKANPVGSFLLQTNGILLHRHDLVKVLDAGVTHLSVSIDAADPDTHKRLRGGTSMAKVHSNLVAFRKACPKVKVVFITTVTSLNASGLEDVVTLGLGLGVAEFVFRELFYFPDSNVVDHSRMPALLLGEGEFARVRDRVCGVFGAGANLKFFDSPTLGQNSMKVRADSFR